MMISNLLSLLTCAVILNAFTVSSKLINLTDVLQGKKKDTKANNNDKKKINVKYDEKLNTLFVSKIDVDQFVGDSINFHGADVANAHLVNVTIDGHIPHLAIDTLEIKAESGSIADGTRMATFNPRGGLSTAKGVKWDERKEMLQLQRLSSLSSNEGIHVHSDLDMNFHKLRNFKLDENVSLKNLKLESSIIADSKIVNATLEDLTLGSVTVDSLSISSLQHDETFLLVVSDGNISTSSSLKESSNAITVEKKIEFTKPVDFKGSLMENVHITSGELVGNDIDLNVNNIDAHSLRLKPLKDAKSHLKDTLIVAKEDGSLDSSNIVIEEGWIRDMKIFGSIDFRGKSKVSDEEKIPGKIVGPLIEGGMVKELKRLHVSGNTVMDGNFDVKGDAFIDGGVTVGGSVLGSGPYIDVSDKRLKSDIKMLSSNEILQKLSQLQAIQYKLNFHTGKKDKMKKVKEFGFLAQDVAEVFPDLVVTRPDGFLGLQYSRFIPLVVEGLKEVQFQMNEIKGENQALKEAVHELRLRIEFLEAKDSI